MPPAAQPSIPPRVRLGQARTRLTHIYRKEIWQSAFLKDRSLKGCCYAVLRVVSITLTVAMETRIATRAAALSFSSILGLGPLIAIAVLVAGFALGKDEKGENDKLIADTLNRMVTFVAPQLRHYDEDARPAAGRSPANAPSAGDDKTPSGPPPAPGDAEVGNAPALGRGVSVTVTNGVATLTGRVASEAQRAVAEKNVRERPDVRSLENQIVVVPTSSVEVDPTLVTTISGIIDASKDGKIGALGVFSLLFVVLLMFKAVEDTFNDIWGVRQGRSVLTRIVMYWTVLTLGAVLFFTAVALLGAQGFVSIFKEYLKTNVDWISAELIESVSWLLNVFSFALLALLLMLFYRVIPNTRVFWRPAFAGGAVVTVLLALNNFVAFLYVKRVVMEKNLYGGLALPLVLLSVLYIFWLCVLIGGIVSYAIQNVHFRNSQAAWATLSESMRERLQLVVFLTVCRRFRECLPPISASDLSTLLKVPTQLLNECVNRLVLLKLITTVRPPADTPGEDYLYQPSRPLNRITLFDFKTLDDSHGENPISSSLEHIDPLIARYDAALARLGEQDFFQKNLEDLLSEHAPDESRPPFAMGARVAGRATTPSAKA